MAAAPTQTAKPDQSADRPTAESEEPAPIKAAEKPVPPPCDQLVMRSGDLIDANILEIGVNEIRSVWVAW